MLSRGAVAPESSVIGGLTKNVNNCACCCDLETVATITPIPIPASAAAAPATVNNHNAPRTGRSKTITATVSATNMTTIMSTNTGEVLASSISLVWAGVDNNCSIVPVSFSFTASAEATSEALMNMMMLMSPVI